MNFQKRNYRDGKLDPNQGAPGEDVSEHEKRRKAEIEKGQQIGARAFLQQQFDPDYVPNAGIIPEERARRDAYVRQMKIGRGEDPDAA